MAAARFAVLLGEPGIGKSTAVNDAALRGDQSRFQSTSFDLGRYSSESQIEQRVLKSELILDWQGGDHDLHVTFDGLDEAMHRVDGVDLLLADRLEDWDPLRLHLRMACRTADWPRTLEDSVRAIAERAGTSLSVFELLPLRRRDAVEIVADLGVDAEQFLDAVETAGLVPLAARPLTLGLLVRGYRGSGQLASNASAAFESGLLALCEEQYPGSRPETRGTGAGQAQTFDAAKHIAARSVFGARPLIWTGSHAAAEHMDLTAVDCGFGDTAAERDAATTSVRAALHTGLFAGAGEGRLAWAHVLFASFLAARWVLDHRLTEPQVRSLVLAPDGGIPASMSEVAAWLVSLRPDEFDWLIGSDPEAFLAPVSLPGSTLRAQVVGGLIRLVRAGTTVRDFARDFRRLSHPELSSQVRAVFTVRDDPATSLCIQIASNSGLRALVPDLAHLAADPAREPTVRRSAAHAVHRLRDDDPSDDLRDLIARDTTLPPRDGQDLQGIALLATWPHALSTAAVFDCLEPQLDEHFVGAYAVFLSNFASALSEDDLAVACAWVLRSDSPATHPSMSRLIEAVVKLALDRLDDEQARFAVAVAVLAQAARYDSFKVYEERAHTWTHTDRRALAVEILQTAVAGSDVDPVFVVAGGWTDYSMGLLGGADLAWLLEAIRDAPAELRRQLLSVVQVIDDYRIVAHTNLVLSLPPDHPAYDLFSDARAIVDLDSAEAAEARKSWRQHLERAERIRQQRFQSEQEAEQVAHAIDRLAEEGAGGNTDAYWQMMPLLTVPPGQRRYADHHQPDVTQHPRWPTLSKHTQLRIVDGARRYVRHGRCQPESWLRHSNIAWFPASAGYRSLLLLLRTSPEDLTELSGDVWREWAPVIVAWHPYDADPDGQDRRVLISSALPHARNQMRDALLALVDVAGTGQSVVQLETQLDALMDETLADALFDRLDAIADIAFLRDVLVRALGKHDLPRLCAVLALWLSREGRSQHHERALAALLALFDMGAVGWPIVAELIRDDPKFVSGALLGSQLIHERSVRPLTDADLADLYVFLVGQFPPEEDPSVQGMHVVQSRETVGHWRDTIREALIERGSAEAVAALASISAARPNSALFRDALDRARRAHRDESWRPVAPAEVERLAMNGTSRLVRNEKELRDLIVEALRDIAEHLGTPHRPATLLWDTHSRRPKSEDEISDYLADHLNDAIGSRGAVVNREVHTRRTRPSGLGERVDLQIDLLPADTADTERFTVVCEVKGCWNGDVKTALREQLAERYMADVRTQYGVYVVIWADPDDDWDVDDPRRTATVQLGGRQAVSDTLAHIAEQVSQPGREISVVVLDISRGRKGWPVRP